MKRPFLVGLAVGRVKFGCLGAFVCGVIVTGCGLHLGRGVADKAGGQGRPITLRLALPDGPGNAPARAATYFARRVRDLSGGRMRVRILWQAAGASAPRWELRVVAMVRRRDVDLALVPARAWAESGVASVDALVAPFVINSDAVVRRVVAGPLTAPMLAGLRAAGVVGLAMVPGGLRHPFSFGRPMLTRSDYVGAAIRAPYSTIVYASLRALGARPVDVSGLEFAQAAARGRIAAAESGYELARTLPQLATATGNVTPFARIDVLASAAGVFSNLSARDRAVLRRAAVETTRYAIRTGRADQLLAKDYCAAGGGVASASEDEVRALATATAPITTSLERDPRTRRAIGLIRAWGSALGSAVEPVPTCRVAVSAGKTVRPHGSTDITALDGVYRIAWSERQMVQAGVSPSYAHDSYGIQTWTLRHGRYVWHTQNGQHPPDCRGPYTITGRSVSVDFDVPGGCQGVLHATWTLTDGLLRLRVQGGTADDRIYFGAKPWRRIADVPRASR